MPKHRDRGEGMAKHTTGVPPAHDGHHGDGETAHRTTQRPTTDTLDLEPGNGLNLVAPTPPPNQAEIRG